ncbi:hypothetical protein ScPMuIL_011617 [Solemya velum]
MLLAILLHGSTSYNSKLALIVHTEIDKVLNKPVPSRPSTVSSMIAGGLSSMYLPPLPPPVEIMPQPKKVLGSPRVTTTQPFKGKTKSIRTSLKEEIDLATALYEPPVGFKKRTSYDLHRIVEDQWRKELQQRMEEEEDERQKELVEKQNEIEKKQQEIAEKKVKKLSGALHKESDDA